MAVQGAPERARRLPSAIEALKGPLAAYALVLGLTAVCAVVVFVHLGEPPPTLEEAAAAMAAEQAQRAPAALKLPQRPVMTFSFRQLTQVDRMGLVEVTEDGLRLPRISPDGWMPWIAYARRYDPDGPLPRVGLLMINVGGDEALMRQAINQLPGEVSLAFLPGTPDLPRWMNRAREHGHESYLMLPADDADGLAERGIKPIEDGVDAEENLRRLRQVLARGQGYVGLVVPQPGPVSVSATLTPPLAKEIADRGLGLIEINPPAGGSPLYRLTVELGVGYARSSTVVDYKLAGRGVGGNLDRMTEWVGEAQPDRSPRHDFAVLQPDAAAVDAIVAWQSKLAHQQSVSFVPIIGHFECRAACMARLRVQPLQLRP